MMQPSLAQAISYGRDLLMISLIAIAILIRTLRTQLERRTNAPIQGSGSSFPRLMAAHKRYFPASRLRIAMFATLVFMTCAFCGDLLLIHKQQQQTLATLQQYRLRYR